jgi:hypothetical protein
MLSIVVVIVFLGNIPQLLQFTRSEKFSKNKPLSNLFTVEIYKCL